MPRLNVRHEKTFVDKETGEIIGYENDFYFKTESEPHYVKLYLLDIARLAGISTRTMSIFLQFLKLMDYKNEVTLAHESKLEICKALNIMNSDESKKPLNTNVVDQHIIKMINIGLMARKGRGKFLVNPHLFGKGQWKDIKEIVLQIKYDNKGRSFLAELTPKPKKSK